MGEHDGWSAARIRYAEESLRAAVEKADRIVEEARERAARDAATEDDEMLDPLNRTTSRDDSAEDDEPPALLGDMPAERPKGPSYLRDAW